MPAPARQGPIESAPRPSPAPQASLEDLERSLRESGLQLVQTKPDIKVDLPPEPAFVPAKRTRRPPPPDLGQPLQMVETRKE